jgi:hypothetical protein
VINSNGTAMTSGTMVYIAGIVSSRIRLSALYRRIRIVPDYRDNEEYTPAEVKQR